MQIETSTAAIRKLKADRHTEILPVPDSFVDHSTGVRVDRRYGLREPVLVRGRSSFENRRSTIEMRGRRGPFPTIGYRGLNRPLHAEHAIKGEHNIQLGDVKIIEHVLALSLAMNLDVDFSLSQPSFPTFDYCNRPFLDGAKDRLVDLGAVRRFTIKRAFAGIFDKGYFILEPAESARQSTLVMDHQISYPGQAVGNQRIVADITPELFAFLCSARTTSFRPETKKIYWLTRLGIARFKYPVTVHNILFADAHKLYNPRKRFDGPAANYEFIFHELMDVMAWLRFLEVKHDGKFVGRLTTFYFDHHKQVDAARYVCLSPDFQKRIGIRML